MLVLWYRALFHLYSFNHLDGRERETDRETETERDTERERTRQRERERERQRDRGRETELVDLPYYELFCLSVFLFLALITAKSMSKILL